MLIFLPWSGERQILYAYSTDYKQIFKVRVQRHGAKIKERVPRGAADLLPALCRYKILGLDEAELGRGWYDIEWVPARWLKRAISRAHGGELIVSPYRRKPKNIFRAVRDACRWLSRYYTLARGYCYAMGYEPQDLFVRRFWVSRNIMILLGR